MDFGKHMALEFVNLRHQALGSALPIDLRRFASEHWESLAAWLRTEEGKIAAQTLISDWRQSVAPVKAPESVS